MRVRDSRVVPHFLIQKRFASRVLDRRIIAQEGLPAND